MTIPARWHGVAAGPLVSALVLIALLGACAPTASPQPPGPSATGPVTVMLGIYSGRPDPTWTLTPEQAATLEAMLVDLPEQSMTPPVGGLGYHGFTIERAGGARIAYLGVIAPPGEGPRASRVDAGRRVERFLLETGRARLDAVEISTVESALR